MINVKREVIQSKHDQILTQIEDIPIEFSNRKNTQRILAFLDYCYTSADIRHKVISSDKITYSLIECLNNIDYDPVDNFEAMYDIWRICIKYFNIPNLGKQAYFDRLCKVIHSKCCLIHNLDFIRGSRLKQTIQEASNVQEVVKSIMDQYTLDITGDFKSLNEHEIEKLVSVAMFLRIKLLNLIMTFYNLVLESQPADHEPRLSLEMNISTDNYFTGEISLKDDHLNFSQLIPLLDILLANVEMFRLWDFTSTLSETLYLTHKLIDFSGGCQSGSKLIYSYLTKVIEADRNEKFTRHIPICDFGQNEPKSKLGIPYCYLKNVLQTMEIMPTAEGQSDLTLVNILILLFDYYELMTTHTDILTEHTYQSFLIVLSRVEVQRMHPSMLEPIFTIFNETKDKYLSNTNVLCQLVFLKRLIIYWFDDHDIFSDKPVVEYYYGLFNKFEEYMSMLKCEKIDQKIKKTEAQKAVLVQHSIKNSKAIKIIEETINALMSENSEIKKTLSISDTADFEDVFEEHITYLKCITVLVYEILILSFKFEKFTKKVDPVHL